MEMTNGNDKIMTEKNRFEKTRLEEMKANIIDCIKRDMPYHAKMELDRYIKEIEKIEKKNREIESIKIEHE